jgi:hypothetical protein
MNASSHMRTVCGALLLMLAACGGGSSEPEPLPAVQVSPVSANLTLAEPQTFTASVAGVANPAFVWSASTGTIVSASGATLRYQAPDNPGSAVITASSPSAPGMDGIARVEIVRPGSVTVTVSPANVDLYPLQKVQFTSSIQGTYLTTVDWSSNAGTLEVIDSTTIRWVAPSAPATYQITARSQANPGAFQSAMARVLAPPLVIFLTPSQASIPVGGSIAINRNFSTNETPGVDISVNWSSTGGSLTPTFDGQIIFSAAAAGVYVVTARSNSYPSVFATAQITVQ